MNARLTPQVLRELLEGLTGLKVIGVIEKQSQLEEEAYKVNVEPGSLFCLRKDDGWMIVLYDQKDELAAWDTRPSSVAYIGIQVIDSFVRINEESVHPVYEHLFIDIPRDIERKTYRSDVGPIVIHTRRHPLGTEGVIEVVRHRWILRYLWERATGAINTGHVVQLKSLPF